MEKSRLLFLSTAEDYMNLRSRLTRDARRLLDVLSWLAPSPMPMRHLTKIRGIRDPHASLKKLCEWNLATLSPDGEAFAIDPRLQEITRENQSLKKPRALIAALNWLEWETLEVPINETTSPSVLLLVPHALFAANAAADRGILYPCGSLLNNCGLLFRIRRDYRGAEPLFRNAVAVDEKALGDWHPFISDYLNNLAFVLKATDRTEEANALIRRALQIDKDSEGYTHPKFRRELGNRVSWKGYNRAINNGLGKQDFTNRLLEKTEYDMRRTLQTVEESVGDSHPAVAYRLTTLATLLQDTNRPEEAERLMRRASQITEAWYGDSHPYEAICLENLANLLHATNQLGKAEPPMRQALRIFEDSLGAEHPSSVRVRGNLERLEAEMRNRKGAPEGGGDAVVGTEDIE